ncbi:hypothetical protein ABXT66_07365 [Candidatus Levibacter sp. Uisw_134_01]|uniref:hypothetical protein n=1 Tax=Candidatus Levibacter sp. Uisw_134_01 TaxID=3230999 RepID=UPI003D4C97FD
MNWQQKMNDSTDLRNRILQMREANNLNLVSEKSEHVDKKVIPKEETTPEDNVIEHKENFKSTVTNEISSQETDFKNISLLNNKKSSGNETLSNNSNKENNVNFTGSNEVQFRILATKFNEAVEVILELSDKVSKLEQTVYKTHSQSKKENSYFNFINMKMIFIVMLISFLTLGMLYFPIDLSKFKLILNEIISSI